jgi:hypothetical protein
VFPKEKSFPKTTFVNKSDIGLGTNPDILCHLFSRSKKSRGFHHGPNVSLGYKGMGLGFPGGNFYRPSATLCFPSSKSEMTICFFESPLARSLNSPKFVMIKVSVSRWICENYIKIVFVEDFGSVLVDKNFPGDLLFGPWLFPSE